MSQQYKMPDIFSEKKFNLFDYSSNSSGSNVFVSYKGPFTEYILKDIGEFLAENLGPYERASKKLFKIFIELAQNISYYSAESNRIGEKITKNRVGSIVIGELKEAFFLTTGNLVSKTNIEILVTNCEHINSLDREKLREYKREQRNRPPGENDGAHIGLITVALTSQHPLDIDIKSVDENFSFFSLTVYINK